MAYSSSKVHISEDAARAIAAAHLGSGRKLCGFEELKEGYFNTAALLRFDDGLACVLKVAPPPGYRALRYERDIMRAEVESLRLVREQTDVSVPEVYAYDTSRSLLSSEFFLMECLPGIPFHQLRGDLPAEAVAEIEREMGRMARAISEITGEAFGYWSQPAQPGTTWRDCFADMVRGILQDGIEMGVVLPLSYEEIFALLERHFPALDEVTVPRLVHWDLWDGNVFVDPHSRRVTGLIDFERVLWADPLIEVVFIQPSPDTNYVQGFGATLFEEFNQIRRRMLYNSYLYLIMIIECYYRHFDNQNQENWARARLAEMIDWLRENGD